MSTEEEKRKEPRDPRRGRHRSSIIEAHNIYVKYHKDLVDAGPGLELPEAEKPMYADVLTGDDPLQRKPESFPMFHRVEKTGVIYATKRASSRGFSPTNPEWANMG